MSRHIIPNAPDSPAGRETTVGWDAPLNTFFGMAFDPPESGELDDDEAEVFWVGHTPGELPDISALAHALAVHGVDLPVLVARNLVEDQAREGDQSADRPGAALVTSLLPAAGEGR